MRIPYLISHILEKQAMKGRVRIRSVLKRTGKGGNRCINVSRTWPPSLAAENPVGGNGCSR